MATITLLEFLAQPHITSLCMNNKSDRHSMAKHLTQYLTHVRYSINQSDEDIKLLNQFLTEENYNES